MKRAPTAVFLVNLIQDVNILRPLVFMAALDFAMDTLLLVSSKFTGRDLFGIWRRELEEMCAETTARLEFFDDNWEAHRHLKGRGVIFAASESHLHNHVTTHSVFRHAPPGFVRVTLQHGFECVGFRHSADHVRAHGKTASFGADYVCGWSAAENLISVAPSQLGKLLVTGPTAVLQAPTGAPERTGREPGLVCENLHSVRLNGAGDFKAEFVGAFSEFCRRLAEERLRVALRPHPGGQYVLKNKVPVPPNAAIENAPIYRTNLRRFAYGISAPSSVLIDMLLAEIPTAVWRDREGEMDADTYGGLTTVSNPAEWVKFALTAIEDPAPFLETQKEFLESQGMVLDPADVYARYAGIFRMVLRAEIRPVGAVAERERVLFVANSHVPTLQLSFEKPLAPLVSRGEFTTELLTEQDLRERPGLIGDGKRETDWVHRHLDRYGPSLIIFCRYSGPAHRPFLEWAMREEVPVVYHVDDDLLAVPSDIGDHKRAYHNSPDRLATVRDLLTSADLVYASTEKLHRKLLQYFPNLPVTAGSIYCSSPVLKRPTARPARKVGYMASADHAHNLIPILPALERMLARNPQVQLEFFGSVPMPPSLQRYANRISTAPPVTNYSSFLTEFAARDWDIGICPLTPIDFNLMKANTKWVEYTSVGAAVVASRGTVYDESCAGGCGLLADTPGEWLEALELLLNDGEERRRIVERAQTKLEREFSVGRLRNQVLKVIEQAHNAVTKRRQMVSEDQRSCRTA